ncbi:MAG: hypothetical protein ACHQ2Z_09705 [Elusimicrobiota bacterium]
MKFKLSSLLAMAVSIMFSGSAIAAPRTYRYTSNGVTTTQTSGGGSIQGAPIRNTGTMNFIRDPLVGSGIGHGGKAACAVGCGGSIKGGAPVGKPMPIIHLKPLNSGSPAFTSFSASK